MNKMIYILLVFAAIAFGSCNDFLKIEPESDMTAQSFWKTASDANSGVAAIYYSFSQAVGQSSNSGSNIWTMGELAGDNFEYINPISSQNQIQIVQNLVRYDNPDCSWSKLYQTISKANNALKYMPDISMSAIDKNRLLASAYTLRAWSYFYLVRTWGDVPLTLQPIESSADNIFMRRTKKESIYNIILQDLLQADLLMSGSTFVDKKYVTNGLIYALEMDVYAWLHQYDMVEKVMVEKVNPLIASNSTKWGLGFTTSSSFSANWRSMFLEDPTVLGTNLPKEIIFKMNYVRTENGTNGLKGLFTAATNYPYFTESLLDAYASTDLRKAAMGSTYLSKKFIPDGESYSVSNQDNDLVLYRFADLQLLYAEALCMQSKISQAVVALNATRVRAGLTAYIESDFIGPTDLLNAILLERRLELVGEGKRWFDLVRTNTYPRKGNSTDDPNSVYLPLYREHLLQNQNLVLPPID
ncbi:MAG: RagB/SusD family nutrient uptake outer membrane protein [Bacteroidota bacterium]